MMIFLASRVWELYTYRTCLPSTLSMWSTTPDEWGSDVWYSHPAPKAYKDGRPRFCMTRCRRTDG